MKKIEHNKIDYSILWKNLHEKASIEEEQQLHAWLRQNSKHRMLYEQMELDCSEKTKITQEQLEKQWDLLDRRISLRTKMVSWKYYLSYAACFLLILGVGTGLFFNNLSNNADQVTIAERQIEPGESKAILQLSGGETLQLCSSGLKDIKNSHGAILASDSCNVLKYSKNGQPVPSSLAKNSEQVSVSFNTIKVPRGGEYQVVLSDGTKVWLNAETELRFPVSFAQSSVREVFLTGEAYFEVSKDPSKSFQVHSLRTTTKVYGTAFNVMSYPDEFYEQTTLVEGSVALLFDDLETVIEPGQQSCVRKNADEIEVKEVDTRLYTDWRDGIFRFENMTLGNLALKLSRWYDIDFTFEDEELKQRKVTGAYKRSTDFEFFIRLIESSSETRIEVKSDQLIIRE